MLFNRFSPAQWKAPCQRRCCRREGTLLLIVLVTVVVLSLSAYTFTTLMQTENQATHLMTLRLQTKYLTCLLYTSPSPRDQRGSRMPSSA